MRIVSPLLALVLFTFLAPFQRAHSISAGDIGNLTLVSPQPAAVDLTAVTRNGTTLVAGGSRGVIVTSGNGGVAWTARERIPVSDSFGVNGLANDCTRYVAIMFNQAAATTDLETWSLVNLGINGTGLAFGDGLFVATGQGAVPLRLSADGSAWSEPADVPDGTPALRGIAFGSGVFVAGGDDGTLIRSTDGQNWTTTFSGIPERSGAANRFTHVSFANGMFFATGSSGLLYTSPDGEAWTAQSPDTMSALRRVAFIDGRYVFGNTLSSTFVTTDFVEMDRVNFDTSATAEDFAIVDGTLVTVGREGYLGTTTTGLAWTTRREVVSENFSSLAFGAGRFVTLDPTASAFYSSTNGVNWAFRFQATGVIRTKLARGADRFVILTVNSTIHSEDGVGWTEEGNDLSFNPDALKFVNDRFVAIGRQGELAESADGVTWISRNTGSQEWLRDISYGAGTYVVANDGDTLLTSPDLIEWTPRTTGNGGRLSVEYGNGRFIAASSLVPLAVSTDGLSWSQVAQPPSFFVNSLAYDPELGFYLFGAGGVIRYLPNDAELSDWETLRVPTSKSLGGLAEGNGVVVGVGGTGLILTTASSPESYAGWVLANFPGESDPEIVGLLGDPDDDWVTNLEEYARGTNPNATTPLLATSLVETSFGPELSWTAAALPGDVSVKVEHSGNLVGWSDEGVLLTSEDLGGGAMTYTARVTGEAAAEPKLFLRIRWILEE